MIGEVIQLFYRMVQGVFSPTALAGLSDKEISQIAGWGDLQTPIVPWLPNCARNIRFVHQSDFLSSRFAYCFGRFCYDSILDIINYLRCKGLVDFPS